MLGNDDGALLEELIGRAGPSRMRVRMELETEYKPPAGTENVYGMVPGSGGEYVLIMARQDGWFGVFHIRCASRLVEPVWGVDCARPAR